MRNCLLLVACIILLNGCTSIVDSLTTKPIEPDPTRTGVLTNLNDVKMSTFIGVNIKKADPGLDDSHINVTTVNSVVLLAGEVPSNELKQLAGNVARAYSGVRKVHNELQVRGNTTLVSRTNDSIIAAQIKTKLVFEKQIDSSQINVVAEDGIVFLMGLTTKNNGNLAAEIASGNSGVRKVVKVFEYVD
jgi:osmotically-inducible protein OsmY